MQPWVQIVDMPPFTPMRANILVFQVLHPAFHSFHRGLQVLVLGLERFDLLPQILDLRRLSRPCHQ
jgi:hypothetical protein